MVTAGIGSAPSAAGIPRVNSIRPATAIFIRFSDALVGNRFLRDDQARAVPEPPLRVSIPVSGNRTLRRLVGAVNRPLEANWVSASADRVRRR